MGRALVVLSLLAGLGFEAGAVRIDSNFSVGPPEKSAPAYCCCKKKKCRPGALSADEKTPAVYSPNHGLCCKGKNWACTHIFGDWGYTIVPPSSDFCVPGATQDKQFDLPDQEDLQAVAGVDAQPGTPAHTVQNYCDFGGKYSAEAAEEQIDDTVHSAVNLDNHHRNEVIGALVKELSKNSLDSMAKEIFSLYVCVRWAPSEEFVSLAQGEVDTEQFPEGSEPLGLYSSRRFIPLRCSQNVNVYESTNNANETHFKVFEETLNAIVKWFRGEVKGALPTRLRSVGELDGDALAEERRAFDLELVQKAAAKCDGSAGIFVDTFAATAQELMADCAAARWWLSKLVNWHTAMPFTSFMAPDAETARKAVLKADQQILVCFGKRVASQMHRRANGNHLLTDQSAVGCHGFWDLAMAANMLDRTVQLWRPPTCQLAAMELDMKMKIMNLIADMNTRLFGALPAMMMDEMNPGEDNEALVAAGSLGIMTGVLSSVVSSFSSMRGTYARLGELLGNTVVKWAVCPLKALGGEREAAELDGALGVEDDLARYYAEQAYAKWTGKTNLLPGEQCGEDAGSEGLPKCTVCSLGVMQENMPEPYRDEEFVCPVRPLLPAKPQLEVLQGKKGLCFMHMTADQWRARAWMYRGRQPHMTQYNKTENAPTPHYEIVKITHMKSRPDAHFGIWRDFVTVGRRCTEAARELTPRWCEAPDVANVPSAVGTLVNAGKAALGEAARVGTGVRKGLEMAGYLDESPPSNQAHAAHLASWFYGAGKRLEAGLKTAWRDNFGHAAKRYKKLYEKSFAEVEAGELLHSASFQRVLPESGADSKRRQKFDRYAVVCPCENFEPNLEFRLKYKWSENALHILRKARKQFGAPLLENPAFGVQLLASQVLHMSDNANAWVDGRSHIRAGGGAGGAWTAWHETKEPFINLMTGITQTSGDSGTDEGKINGFSATFACGTRKAMHDLPFDPSASSLGTPFWTCVTDGAARNEKLRQESPTAVFFPEETVVRVTFAPMDSCYAEASTTDGDKPMWKPTESPNEKARRNFFEKDNPLYKTFSAAGKGCLAPSAMGADQPAHLEDARAEATFRGVLVAKGLPRETLTEVLLDPEDLLEAF